MKLLYASVRPPYPFMQGGASRSAHYLLSALASGFGVDCRAIGFRGFSGAGWACPVPEEYAALGISEVINGKRHTSIRCGYTAQVGDDFPVFLAKVLDEFAPDVVWTQLDGFEAISKVATAKGHRVLVYLRDAEASEQTLEAIVATGSRLVVNSNFIAGRIKRITGLDAPVIYPSLDAAYGVTGDPQGTITMINPHRVKGIDTFLEIARRMPGEDFLIVESWLLPPPAVATLLERIAPLPNVRFQRRVSDVGQIYRQTKLLLAPSVWEEAFGRVVIEAQSCRIPVIASERGGLPEAVGEGGICVSDYQNADAWVAAIEGVLRDPDAYRKLADEGYRHATGGLFSSNAAARRFFSICSEGLADARGPAPGSLRKGQSMGNKSKPGPEAGPARKDPAGSGVSSASSARADVSGGREATSRYVFFSSQRTGSTYLCRRLCNVENRFGLPMEYLNPKILQGVVPGLAVDAQSGLPADLDLDAHLRSVERVRTTADGCFGIKIQPQQLLPYLQRANENPAGFLRRYGRIIVLTRRDKLGQAISGALAQASGKWFDDGADPVIEDGKLADLCPDVAFRLSRYVREEALMLRAAGRSGRPVLHLEYEEMLADPEGVFERVLVFLGEPRGVSGIVESDHVRVPRKAAGELARRLRAQFLDFIAGTGAFAVPVAAHAGEKAG